MKLKKIKEILKAEVLTGDDGALELEITNACGADLISDILADTKRNAVLLTGLTHRQIIQTAGMSEFAAIIFVRGKCPTGDVIELAKERGIPLLCTDFPLYESCGLLYEAGLKGDFLARKVQEEQNSSENVPGTMRLVYEVHGGDFENAGRATEQAKKVLKQLGVNPSAMRRASIVAYEAEMNIVIHAFRGKLIFEVTPYCIEITAEDEGPGIENIELAMQEGYSTAPERIREMGFGAGMGLPNMKKFSDVFEITSVVAKGTKVKMKIYL
ncbi:Anti-sigma regulatory factor (Ser/Thr protein kinase) [Caldanaerovirga acetigignens]|jgi:anti-sigma regulatory factor (Ser/Thr protein kinase)|uniref:Anti-sigma regulatory factor (Ser/Thr protein kinase) n=1 Tax=Caldanaerovirga acetigignens TaxID=447595 RepID=A0A1M7KEI0_9FIRM|nr:ATP-binding protein [Caldanaerovirga acetigignens]SHM63445.1 Anti-sigma regulatory factor (Ser/Thr protein kinase) [Caldanaerovirga acetigignens]